MYKSTFSIVLFVASTLVGIAGAAYSSSTCATPELNPEQLALVQAAKRAGATGVDAAPTDDGGLRLSGNLEGHEFALVIPWRWNHEVMLYAHGYSDPGTPVDVPINPVADDGMGIFRIPYAEGMAVGLSAYDKAGVGVESAVINTHRLRKLVGTLGATRAYLIGLSMGGDIVMATIEKYPKEYSGAIALCGVVGGWTEEINRITDVRAAYNYFAHGTAYELPGEKSVARSMLPTPAASGLSKREEQQTHEMQVKRIVEPVFRLFAEAKAHPGGAEDRMLDNIAAVANTQKNPSSFTIPLVLLGLGQGDMNKTFGGLVYDNSAKVYSSPHLSNAKNAELNRDIERVHADSGAVARANAWYRPSGKFETKLISLYNTVDPIVPTDLHEPLLRKAIEASNNLENFVDRPVPQKVDPSVYSLGVPGIAHCGFTADEIDSAFNDLRAWVETDKKPN